jgi:hypothetical protein
MRTTEAVANKVAYEEAVAKWLLNIISSYLNHLC